MKLVWSRLALADRDNIFDYIEAENPLAAIAIDERIQQQVERLLQFPAVGRSGRVTGTRELVLNRTSYIAAYRLEKESIVVLRVLHGAQLWPDEIPIALVLLHSSYCTRRPYCTRRM